jgi:hypothetical protein
MTKPICISGKQYSSLVDCITEVDGRVTVRTSDDRFFNFDPQSVRLLRELEHNSGQFSNVALLSSFVEQVLIKKGIYLDAESPQPVAKKQPALSLHQSVLPAFVVSSISARLKLLPPCTGHSFVVAGVGGALLLSGVACRQFFLQLYFYLQHD